MKNQILKSIFLFFLLSSIFSLDSKAQIIYTDVNPDSTVTSGYNITKTYGFDLNNDGTVDFILREHTTAWAGLFKWFVAVTTLNTNEVLDSLSGGDYYPVALGLNSSVGANLKWRHTSGQTLRSEVHGQYNSGFWSVNTDAFLGLKLIAGSDTLYGWVRLSIQKNGYAISFTIKDYAYNTIPNQPILAGETSCAPPAVNLTQSGTLSFCAGDSVALTANGTGYKYQWKKDGVNISGAKSQTYIAKTAGIYKCKVTNSCGSKLSTGKTVSVSCRDASPDNIGISMTSAELEPLSVFPNPATNSVTIKFPSDEEGEVQIVNLFGRVLETHNYVSLQDATLQIDVSKYPVGMYVVKWNSGENSETKTFSVVK